MLITVKLTPPKIIGGEMAGYKFVFILYLVFKSKLYQISWRIYSTFIFTHRAFRY